MKNTKKYGRRRKKVRYLEKAVLVLGRVDLRLAEKTPNRAASGTHCKHVKYR